MSKLSLTLACAPYDRVQALLKGAVSPEGIDLNFLPMEVEEIFWRQLRYGEFDVSECSLSSYSMIRAKGMTGSLFRFFLQVSVIHVFLSILKRN